MHTIYIQNTTVEKNGPLVVAAEIHYIYFSHAINGDDDGDDGNSNEKEWNKKKLRWKRRRREIRQSRLQLFQII